MLKVNRFQQFAMNMSIINLVEFREWFWGKFDRWRGKTTKGPTAYARYLGIKQQYVSDWLSGKYTPKSQEHIQLLAEKYPDVYQVLGLRDPLDALPPGFAERLRLAIVEIREAIEQEGVSVDSPRADEIKKSIMDKFGFEYKDTE